MKLSSTHLSQFTAIENRLRRVSRSYFLMFNIKCKICQKVFEIVLMRRRRLAREITFFVSRYNLHSVFRKMGTK